MAGRDQATSRPLSYRRRLLAAAVASLALHLLLARGLALTRLGLDGPRATADAEPRSKPEPRADFAIRVPRTPAQRPAHERPLAIAAVRPPSERPAPARPAASAATPRASEEPAETVAPQSAAAPTPTRDAALADAAAPARAAIAAAAPAVTEADGSAAAAAAAADAAAAPAAVSRQRATDAAVASRWRPREVALLERLTAPAPARSARAVEGRDDALPASTAADRAAIDEGAAATAEAITAPAGAPDAPVELAPADRPDTAATDAPAVARRGANLPGDRRIPAAATTVAADVAAARARREAATAATAAGSNRTAGRRATTAADATGAVAAVPAAGGAAASSDAAPAPAAGRRGTPGGGGAVLAGSGRAGAAFGGDGSDAAAPPTTAARGIATIGGRAADGGGSPGDAAARGPARAAIAAADAGGGGSTAIAMDVGRPGVDAPAAASGGPGPRAVGRVGGTAGATADRSALAAAPRWGGEDADGGGEADDELSVPQPSAAIAIDGPRRDDEGPAAGPRPPERVAVVALPAETRVRDVAEAFARRGRDARRERQADPRAARAAGVVDRGLGFLARAQQADGRWSLGRFAGSGPADVPRLASDTAATGLALLSFLGAGHDHFDGPHRDTVRRGLEFLLSIQKADGDLYLPADELSNSCGWLYSHGIATIALCEAVGMTGDPLLRPAAARACGFIAASQHPELGGWRYVPRGDADLSVSGWMLVALRSGALAGVETDPRSFAGVRTLLDAADLKDRAGGYAYNPRKPEQRASEISGLCMTAVGSLMRLHTGAKPDDPRVTAAARLLAARRPSWDARGRDSYLWYCASQVLVHTGGPEWEAWYTALVDTLASTQETAGAAAGSWNPAGPQPDRWGRQAGRIYVTALHLLALEVPDRRLPTYSVDE